MLPPLRDASGHIGESRKSRTSRLGLNAWGDDIAGERPQLPRRVRTESLSRRSTPEEEAAAVRSRSGEVFTARAAQGLLQVDRHQPRGGLQCGDGRAPEVPCELVTLCEQRKQSSLRQHESQVVAVVPTQSLGIRAQPADTVLHYDGGDRVGGRPIK